MSWRLHYPQPYEVHTPDSKVDVIDNGERCQRHATNMFSIPERLKGRRQINTLQIQKCILFNCYKYSTFFVGFMKQYLRLLHRVHELFLFFDDSVCQEFYFHMN